MQKEGNFSEIFSSLQGEGIYLGAKQIFLRFSGCNLSCDYCDTKYAKKITPKIKIYTNLKEKQFLEIDNPISIQGLLKFIEKMNLVEHHSLSLTGGEPLLQTDFLINFLSLLSWQGLGLKIYLETNGTLPKELEKIIHLVDIIAMDIKLPSDIDGKTYYAFAKKFLKVALRKEVFVKIVISENTKEEEFIHAVETISDVDKYIPLVLQPVTPNKKVKNVSFDKLFFFQKIALKKLKDVRIIPRIHKLLKIL